MDANVISDNVIEMRGADSEGFLVSESKYFTIDDATRKITPPKDFTYLGVESDSNSKRIWFECPRFVGDNLDLTQFNVYINYQNANGDKDRWRAEDVTIDGDKIHFSWKLSRKVLKYKGTVKFIVCALETDAEGEKDPEWNTTLCQGTVLEGLEVENPEPDTPEYDIVNQLLGLFKGIDKCVKATQYGGIVLGDTETNQAFSSGSIAMGENCYAGMRGYYYASMTISEDGTQATFVLTDNQNQSVNDDLIVEYDVSDVVSLVNNSKYMECATIISVDGNRVTVSPAPFTTISTISSPSIDDYSFYCLSKPQIGVVSLGLNAHAEGEENVALERSAHAEGRQTKAYGQYSHAEGRKTEAWYSAHAEGQNTKATGNQSHAEGSTTIASGQAAHGEGYNTKATGYAAHAEGNASEASSGSAHAEGQKTIAKGTGAHAEGITTTTDGQAAHAEGENTKALAARAHAEGQGSQATNMGAHAEGYRTLASGEYSHAEGKDSEAIGVSSHAEGTDTQATDVGSHAEGVKSISTGYASHAEGLSTQAINQQTHAEGQSTIASGIGSHAEGQYCKATGDWSHAQGNSTEASGGSSHAEGHDSIASGLHAHAEGWKTVASGNTSHAQGTETIAASANQNAQGKFNIEDADGVYAHIVGNGTSTQRRNAYTLDWSGNAWYAGTIETMGVILKSPNGKRFKLTVADDGTLETEAI